MSIKDITVIITSFKSGEKIKNCLNSIDRECKVLLIENSNDPNIKKNIEKEFSNVECILTGANLGYGKSNNIGLKKVTTKYALILNPDTTLHPSALENFIKTIEKITSMKQNFLGLILRRLKLLLVGIPNGHWIRQLRKS